MSRPLRAEAPSSNITARLSPEERQRLLDAARVNHQTLADFARDALAVAVGECLEEATAGNRKPKR